MVFLGTKGSHIRNMIKFSGASVKIAQPEGDEAEQQNQERKVLYFSFMKLNTFKLLLFLGNYCGQPRIPMEGTILDFRETS